jgi:hypothetical protein
MGHPVLALLVSAMGICWGKGHILSAVPFILHSHQQYTGLQFLYILANPSFLVFVIVVI